MEENAGTRLAACISEISAPGCCVDSINPYFSSGLRTATWRLS
jgi:hypothetical protein